MIDIEKNIFFGERLKQVRNIHNMTTNELSKKLNVSTSAIHQYEKNKIKPSYCNIIKLCNIFNVNIKYFFTKPPISNIRNITYHKKFYKKIYDF